MCKVQKYSLQGEKIVYPVTQYYSETRTILFETDIIFNMTELKLKVMTNDLLESLNTNKHIKFLQ